MAAVTRANGDAKGRSARGVAAMHRQGTPTNGGLDI
jgi:hypothetical protein